MTTHVTKPEQTINSTHAVTHPDPVVQALVEQNAKFEKFFIELQQLVSAVLEKSVVISTTDTPSHSSTAASTEKKQESAPDPTVYTWDDETDRRLNLDSPLSRLGYSVAENGLDEDERHELLDIAVNSDVLPGVTSNDQKKRWGTKNSPQRIYAISKFLTWLCRFQGSDKLSARDKWISDIQYLREQFYDETMGFDWPEEPVLITSKTAKRTPNAAFMQTLKASPELAAVIGSTPLPRTEIVSKLWTYIKRHGLQDTVNKRMINSDAKLKKVFGKSQVSMFEMAGLIGKHVK